MKEIETPTKVVNNKTHNSTHQSQKSEKSPIKLLVGKKNLMASKINSPYMKTESRMGNAEMILPRVKRVSIRRDESPAVRPKSELMKSQYQVT